MPVVQGQLSPARGVALDQTAGYGATTSILVRDVGSKLYYLDPSAAPFTLLTDRAGSKVAQNPTFEWFEKSLRPKVLTVASTATTGDTAITVTGTGLYAQVNDILLDPVSGEMVRVTAATSGTITVERAIAGTAATTIATTDDLFVIGSAWAEGADVGIPDEWTEVQKFNRTQIFRRPFGASRTREASEFYVGQTRPRLRAEKAIEHAMDIEKAFVFNLGTAELSTTTNAHIRITKGFLGFATSNVKDLGGASLTEPDVEAWFEGLFQHTASGDSRVLFASPLVISAFDMLGVAKLKTVEGDSTYGLSVKQYLSSHGTVNIVKHRLLVNNAGALANTEFASGEGAIALAVDPKMLTMRPISGGTTVLKIDRQNPGVDGWVDEYLTEQGLQLTNPEVMGVLKNVGAAT